MLLVVALIATSGIKSAIEGYTRDYWGDPIEHNDVILRAQSLNDLRYRMAHHFQPIFEYAVRRYFWFPIFGVNERSLRLPDFAAWIALLVAGPWIAWAYFKRRKWEDFPAAVAVVLLARAIASNRELIYMAAEGRHYEFTALLSVLWFVQHVLFEGKPRWLFAMLSLVLANTHFFCIPFIASAYFLEAAALWSEGKRDSAWKQLALLAMGITVTLWINWPAFYLLLNQTPGRNPNPSWGTVWRSIPPLFERLLNTLQLPMAAIALTAMSRNRRLGIHCVLLAGVLVATRWKSQYFFANRYFLPFTGITFCFGLLAMENLGYLIRRMGTAAERIPFWAAASVLLALPAWDMTQSRRSWKFPPKNFTQLSDGFNYIANLRMPTYVITKGGWEIRTTLHYLKVLQKDRRDIRIGSADIPNFGDLNLADFLRDRPQGLVVLDIYPRSGKTDRECQSLSHLPPGPRPIEFLSSGKKCFVLIRKPKNAAEVAAVAKHYGFGIPWLEGGSPSRREGACPSPICPRAAPGRPVPART